MQKFPICFLKEKANEEISLSENLIANVRMGNLRRRYRRECISANQVTFKQELYIIPIYRSTFNSKEVKKRKRVKSQQIFVKRCGCLSRGTCLNIFNFNGEFDPGSELTLAACITHASRTGIIGVAIHL